MKKIICLCLILILLVGVLATLIGCSNNSSSKCNCPHQVHIVTGYLSSHTKDSVNQWLQEHNTYEIVNIQYAFGEFSYSGALYGFVITYIEHQCS